MNNIFLQTVEEITHMETNIVNLRDAKWEKDAPFKVAETRLGNRHQRPNVEMCRDEPSHRYDFDTQTTDTRVANVVADHDKLLTQ